MLLCGSAALNEQRRVPCHETPLDQPQLSVASDSEGDELSSRDPERKNRPLMNAEKGDEHRSETEFCSVTRVAGSRRSRPSSLEKISDQGSRGSIRSVLPGCLSSDPYRSISSVFISGQLFFGPSHRRIPRVHGGGGHLPVNVALIQEQLEPWRKQLPTTEDHSPAIGDGREGGIEVFAGHRVPSLQLEQMAIRSIEGTFPGKEHPSAEITEFHSRCLLRTSGERCLPIRLE